MFENFSGSSDDLETFWKNQGCLYFLIITLQGAGPCLGELLSLLSKHPHPKIWDQSHLHTGRSPFNGKDLLVLLLIHPQESLWSPKGCQGNAPRGERCRLCQVSRHKEHTWSGLTCPGLCPQPAQSPGQEQSKHPAPGCPQREQHPGVTGLKSLLASLCNFSCPRPAKDLGPAASGAAAEPWEEQSSSSSAEPELPHTGAISWKQTFLGWTETEAEVITDTR